jgi:tRNA(Ile)-lysidine synthase
MTSLPDIARATVAAHDLLPPGSVVVVMISGGADSVTLLRLLANGELGDDLHLSGLHINHLLRGDEAEADESFVRMLCESLGVELRVVRFDVAAFAAEGGLNLEDAGRRVRYRFAAEEADARCEASGVPPERGRIAVAHTLDDRIETFLMRLVTGAGATGLTSLRPARDRIVRPLADAPRTLVCEHLASLGQQWREDASNTDTTRLRARMRHDVLPVLRDINPRFDAGFARTLQVLSAEDDMLAEMADAFSRDFVRIEGGRLVLERVMLATLSLAMRRRTIRAALDRAFPDISRLDFEHVEAIVAACAPEAHSSFARDIGDGLRAVAEYDTIVVSRSGDEPGPMAPCLLPIPATVDLGESGRLIAEATATGDISGDPDSVVIDAGRLASTLSVSAPQTGERMRPLGMSGTKKLSDLLVDAKVPVRRRPLTPVVRDGEQVVWLAGVRMSDEYKVGPHTTYAVRLTWVRYTDDAPERPAR